MKIKYMKKILYSALIVMFMVSFTSCLKNDLEDLPEYKDANITSVSAMIYRYISDEKSPASDQYIVKEVNLTYDSDIDKDLKTVDITASIPANFPEAEKNNLSKSNVVVIVSLSTAARIQPIDGSPKLGVPGDWSKSNKYKVLAADGTEKIWTITLTSLTK